MYQVRCDDYLLYDHRDPELILENPEITVEVNTIGSGSFTIYNTHPNFDKLKKMKSIFEVRDEIGVVFRGRMPKDALDFDNVREVELEGVMGFFNDSVVRPYAFPEDFLEDAGYISASESGNVVEFYLKWLIENHNSQVQPFQQFKLGKVTVSAPDNYIARSNDRHTKSWAELKNQLFGSGLGGYLCIRYEADGNYIDYLSKFESTNTQSIVYGENLLDVKQESDATEMFTAIIPIGAVIETESTEESDETITIKPRVNIEELADGNITDDVIKKGDTVYSKSGVENYGWIYADVSDTTWDDIEDPTELLTKSKDALVQKGLVFNNVVEYSACDLHFTDEQIRSFRIYRNVMVDSAPHNQKGFFPLTKLQIPLLNPQATRITVGGTQRTLSDLNFDTAIKLEKTQKDIESTRKSVSSIRNQVYYEKENGNTSIYGYDVQFGVSNIATPGVFRPYIRQGDSLILTFHGAGYVTDNGNEVMFCIPFSAPIIGSPNATITSDDGFILRQGSKYTHGSAAGVYVNPLSYEATVTEFNGVYIKAVFSDTTNAIANDSIGIYWHGTITFS